MPFSKSMATRASYVLLFLLISFSAWGLSAWGSPVTHYIPELKDQCGSDSLCLGTQVIFRVTAALAVGHLLLSLVLIGVKNTSDCRSIIQDGLWPVKILVWLGFIVLAFVIPGNIVAFYSKWSIVGAFFFILVQLVMLVDFAHQWNESWLEKWDEDDEKKGWWYGLLICTVLLALSTLAMSILLLIFFGSTLNVFLVCGNFIVFLLYAALSIHPKIQEVNPRSGLLQSAVIGSYCTYLVGSAIISAHDAGETVDPTNAYNIIFLLVGVGFTVVAVIFSCLSVGSSAGGLVGHDEDHDDEAARPLKGDDGYIDHDDDDEEEHVTYNYALFHLAFCFGAMYMGQLLTNWSVLVSEHGSMNVDVGTGSFAVKFCSVIVVVLLYIWTLIAPVVLKDRIFD